MVDPSDWRLTGQQKDLTGVPLHRRRYRRFAENPAWDHDHGSFCWAKFMEGNETGMLHEGYATVDDHHWICPTCFADFEGMFQWTVTDARESGGG